MNDLEIKDLLDKVYLAFVNINSSVTFGKDKYKLPTYWHSDKLTYSIRTNKNEILIIQYGKILPKEIRIKQDLSVDSIELLIYRNFIY